MSRFCDMIVTINREDEARAKTFHCPRVEHINGIGVDFSKRDCAVSREEKRRELGIGEDDILVLSVGELQTRKNHEVLLRAIARLNNSRIKYCICGRGVLLEHLQSLASELGIAGQVSFLGYRKDIPEIMNASDIYAHPSKREGLCLACLEAMEFDLPLATSNVQGIPDYVENGVTGFLCDPTDVERFAENLKILINDANMREKIGQTNLERIKKYVVSKIETEVLNMMASVR